MKPNSKNTTQAGFTLSELIVVIAIIGLLSTLVVVNFNQQRARRSVLLAQNETVTNARKVQSYALSSRDINATTKPSFYYLQLTTDQKSYEVRALDDGGQSTLKAIETVKLPDETYISSITMIGPNADEKLDCAQVAFSVPFARMYIIAGSTCNGGTIEDTLSDPITLQDAANKTLQITLKHPRTNIEKTLTFHGLSGRIEGN